MKRRSFFGLFAAPVAIPLAKIAPAAAEAVVDIQRDTVNGVGAWQRYTGYEIIHSGPTLEEIITTTLRNRSSKLVDLVSENNALLQKLRGSGAVVTVSPGIFPDLEEDNEDDWSDDD